MKVHFYSKSDDYEIEFFTTAYKEDGFIVFKDESLDNSFIKMKILDNELIFDRYGDVNMKISFLEGEKTSGLYQNAMGLEFKFEAETKRLYMIKNFIELEYNLLIDGEHNNSCKIRVEMNN